MRNPIHFTRLSRLCDTGHRINWCKLNFPIKDTVYSEILHATAINNEHYGSFSGIKSFQTSSPKSELIYILFKKTYTNPIYIFSIFTFSNYSLTLQYFTTPCRVFLCFMLNYNLDRQMKMYTQEKPRPPPPES